jgi:hypothetical protein
MQITDRFDEIYSLQLRHSARCKLLSADDFFACYRRGLLLLAPASPVAALAPA